jgi:hypothetical protein
MTRVTYAKFMRQCNRELKGTSFLSALLRSSRRSGSRPSQEKYMSDICFRVGKGRLLIHVLNLMTSGKPRYGLESVQPLMSLKFI